MILPRMLVGHLTAVVCLSGIATIESRAEAPPSMGFATAPAGAFDIEHAPAPLFRDPMFDGAADPSIVFNPEDGSWLIYYTQRRAGLICPGVAWCYGTKIGIAKSTDQGRNWKYVGAARGLDRGTDIDTFWAPHVFLHEGVYHMFVTYIANVSEDWSGRPYLLHYTSPDGLSWTLADDVDTGSDNMIDAAVVRLPDKRWLLVFRDDTVGVKTAKCVSEDLRTWRRLDDVTGDKPHEGPVMLVWKDKYWLLTDDWQGLGVYVSDDGIHYQRNTTILSGTGVRRDDFGDGKHPGVMTVGDRAFVVYFTHPGRKPGVAEWEADNVASFDFKRSSLQVAELGVDDQGRLTCDRDKFAQRP
ncbi:glycoside hydrolase family protein [Pirellulimonas nuda]|nr:exo-alpha-sialidase [Pirellulimonas nuda]